MIQYTLPSPTEMSGFYVIYKGSAAAEDVHTQGASHLLEHLVCRRLKSLVRELSQYAVEFNAMTSDDYICYYILGIEEYIDRYAERFYQGLRQPMAFSRDEFEAEKQIVMREIGSRRIHPKLQAVYWILEENLGYGGSAGTLSSVDSLTLERTQDLYERQYREPYMTVRVGNRCRYGCHETGAHHALDPKVSLKDLSRHIPLKTPTAENVVLSIGPVIPNTMLPLSQMVNYLFCGNVNSPLYKKVREEMQLCYSIEMTYFPLGDYHINYINALIPPGKMSVAREAIRQVLGDAGALTADSIARATSYFRILARMHDANRYADIRHLLCNTIFAEGQLDSICAESVLKHYEMYYKDGFTI